MPPGHPQERAGVGILFTDTASESDCIYVSSCSNISRVSSCSSFSELELNITKSTIINGLKFYYINADSLLNKMGELEIIIDMLKPDVVVVTEVFPKNLNPSNINSNEYKLKGFTCHISAISNNSRGVVIYTKDHISADYCTVMMNSDFKESVWCELRLNETDKLIVGGIYKSPSSDELNHIRLNELMTQATNLNYKHMIIVGDFNFPDVNWTTWTNSGNENHASFHFIECLRDNFLQQHISSYTRYRDGQNPSCLDLLISDSDDIVSDVQFGDKLGASDHVSIIFNVQCDFSVTGSSKTRPNFYKGNYQDIRKYLEDVDWNEMTQMGVEESWTFFIDHIHHCVDTFIPVKSTNVGDKNYKPKWMDYYCRRKVKKNIPCLEALYIQSQLQGL